MNYVDIYFNRVNHLGENATEVAFNSNIRSFERWLAGSPFSVENLSVERGLYFSGIIQTSKDKEEKKLMYLYVANDIPVQVGDILTWTQDNGTIEKWLLLQKIHGVHDAYQTFQIIKCNYQLKWIDADGYLHKSWAYILSSKDEMVKGNFRMWHSLISPQPNKFAEIIMPRPELKSSDKDQLLRGVTFIIENEGWEVIECDWTSVEGITYMSLTESKVNYQYDDREVDIADLDKLLLPTLPSICVVGEKIIPNFTPQTFNEWQIVLIPPEVKDGELPVIIQDGDYLVATNPGQAVVKMRLKNYNASEAMKAITKEFEITVTAQNEAALYIAGDDSIKLDRYSTYELVDGSTNVHVVGNVEFSIENKKQEKIPLASLVNALDSENNTLPYAIVVRANAKNKLGEVILSAVYNDKTYTKTIKIVPLW